MKTRTDIRAEALDTLVAIDKDHKMAGELMANALMRCQFLPRQERAFYTRLCEGVLERRIYLDYILDHISKTPMRKCRPVIRNLLRMGTYQILFMNVPDAAVCHETVKMARQRGFQRLSGFVNGVLRNLCRSKDHLPTPDVNEDPIRYASIMYSVPHWITQMIFSQYGQDAGKQILASFLEERPMSIRTQLSHNTPEQLEQRLKEEEITVHPGKLFPYAFSLEGVNHLRKLASFREGCFVIQDESSMLPVHIAGIKEGDLILDVCAAPGGKSLHAADRLHGTGTVIARDVTSKKLDLIEENIDRLQCTNVSAECCDARIFDEELMGKADVVLADVPCSGLGIAGKKNDIRYHLSPERMEDLRVLQREILGTVWKYVKPGGQLIYSTCTINREENEENVTWITEHTPLVPASMEEDLPAALQGRTGGKGYLTLLPGIDPCDGFFTAKFIRPEENHEVE